MLAVALGGITPLQICATIVAMIAYVILIANFSLLCSVYAKRSGVAISLVLASLFIFFVSPSILTKISAALQLRGYLGANDLMTQNLKTYCDFCNEISVIEQIRLILTTGYSKSVINAQVGSNFLIGAFCFLTSWMIFDHCTENQPAKKKETSNRTKNRKSGRPDQGGLQSPGKIFILWQEVQTHYS